MEQEGKLISLSSSPSACHQAVFQAYCLSVACVRGEGWEVNHDGNSWRLVPNPRG